MEVLRRIRRGKFILWCEGDIYYSDILPEMLYSLVNNQHVENFILLLNYRRKKFILGIKLYSSTNISLVEGVARVKNPLGKFKIAFGLEELYEGKYYQVLEINNDIKYDIIRDLIDFLEGVVRDIIILISYIRCEKARNSKLYILLETKRYYRKKIKKIIEEFTASNKEYRDAISIANIIDRFLIVEELRKIRCIFPSHSIEVLIELIRKILNEPIYLRDEEVYDILKLDNRSKIFYMSINDLKIPNDWLIIDITYNHKGPQADINQISKCSLPVIIPYIANFLGINIDVKQLYDVAKDFIHGMDIQILLMIIKQNLLTYYDSAKINDLMDQLSNLRLSVSKGTIQIYPFKKLLPLALAVLFMTFSSKLKEKAIVIRDQADIFNVLDRGSIDLLFEIFRKHSGKVIILTNAFNSTILELADTAILDITSKIVREYLERRYGIKFLNLWRYVVINNLKLKYLEYLR